MYSSLSQTKRWLFYWVQCLSSVRLIIRSLCSIDDRSVLLLKEHFQISSNSIQLCLSQHSSYSTFQSHWQLSSILFEWLPPFVFRLTSNILLLYWFHIFRFQLHQLVFLSYEFETLLLPNIDILSYVNICKSSSSECWYCWSLFLKSFFKENVRYCMWS